MQKKCQVLKVLGSSTDWYKVRMMNAVRCRHVDVAVRQESNPLTLLYRTPGTEGGPTLRVLIVADHCTWQAWRQSRLGVTRVSLVCNTVNIQTVFEKHHLFLTRYVLYYYVSQKMK